MSNTIRKSAKVIRITPDEIEVEVCRPEACGACRAKALCHATGGGEEGKRMILLNDRQGYEVGEEVTLVMKQSAGIKAVVTAYLVPVVLIIGTLLGGQHIGISETNTALGALGVLVLYFIGVRLFRSKLSRTLTIEIEKEIVLP